MSEAFDQLQKDFFAAPLQKWPDNLGVGSNFALSPSVSRNERRRVSV
jgi:hypothetical protein